MTKIMFLGFGGDLAYRFRPHLIGSLLPQEGTRTIITPYQGNKAA